MATWIAHLRLAENLLNLIDGLDAESFAISSIAPDSGIPDERREHFGPPAELLRVHRPGVYLTGEEMDRFVELGTRRLHEAYRCLVEKGPDVTGG